MAGYLTYSLSTSPLSYVYTATGGGVTFSANLVSGAFDLFEDAPAVDDAIYFGTHPRYMPGRILFDIATALTGTDVVFAWEYYGKNEDDVTYSWRPVPSQKDDTNGFTTLGSNSFWNGLPYNAYKTTIQGVTSYYWLRCRLVSFTAISEGGRTNAVASYYNRVRIRGYDDVTPCTLEEIYQYMKTNYPHLTGITKIGGFNNVAHNMATYDFREVNFWVESRLLVKNEGFHQGAGYIYGSSGWCGYSSYSYLQLGIKVDNLGTDAGWFIHHSTTNSYPFTISADSKFYGSFIKCKGTGYIASSGEWYGNLISTLNFSQYAASTMINNILDTSLWVLNGMPDPFDGNKVVFSPRLGFIYNTGFVARDLDWVANGTTAVMQFNNSTGANQEWIFIDPITPMPLMTASPRIVYRGTSSTSRNWSRVWYHDVSAGTYTDYTTEANDSTPDSMPLHGDVGDCYYFGLTTTIGRFGLYLRVIANTTNDYQYVWEKYSAAGGWVAASRVVENTNNFSNDGDYYPFAGDNNTMTSLLVNGDTQIYGRLRITGKGTGSPMVTQLKYSSEGCIGDWNIQVKYTFALTVIDKADTLIENANVIVSLDGAEVFNGDTDEHGQIVDQELVYIKHYLDPFGGGYQRISTDTYDGYSIRIEATGFRVYYGDVDMSKKQDLTIALEQSPMLGQGRIS